MTQKVKKNIKILGERISKRLTTNQRQERKQGAKGCLKQSKVAKQTKLQENQWHKWKPCLTQRKAGWGREKLCFVYNGLIETVWKNRKPLLTEVGKLTWLSNKCLHGQVGWVVGLWGMVSFKCMEPTYLFIWGRLKYFYKILNRLKNYTNIWFVFVWHMLQFDEEIIIWTCNNLQKICQTISDIAKNILKI